MMKKIYALFAILFATVVMNAQQLLTVTKNSEGIYTITYNDSANNWAFYDPYSQPIGVYFWLNSGDTTAGSSYNDNWGAISTSLTWDGTNYSGTVNLNNHAFSQGVLPSGTTVNQLHFLFTEFPAGNGSHQTADLSGSSYGFTASTTVSSTLATMEAGAKMKTYVKDGLLYTPKIGNLELELYNFGGQLLLKKSVKADRSPIILGKLSAGNYILKMENGNQMEVLKFRN